MPTHPADATLPGARSLSFLVRGQLAHAAGLALLTIAAIGVAEPTGTGSRLGLDVAWWLRVNILVVIAHQALVALVFRVQLGWGALTRLCGRFDLLVWGALFLPFLAARVLVLVALATADAGSLALPRAAAAALGWALLLPAAWGLFSVFRHFGIPRALGGDHFRLEYRAMPLVRQGAFARTPNAMYALVFLGLWSPALIAGSRVALVAVLYQHAAVWLHYACTEKPDMELMYGGG